jgi:hypothetical protein
MMMTQTFVGVVVIIGFGVLVGGFVYFHPWRW